jgi:hypothetical protein
MLFLLIALFSTTVLCTELNNLSCSSVTLGKNKVSRFLSSHILTLQAGEYEMFDCSVWLRKHDSNITLEWTGLNENYKVWATETRVINDRVCI